MTSSVMTDLIIRLNNTTPLSIPRQSLMHDLAREGDILSAEALLAAGIDPDLPDDLGRKPLHEAAFSGHLDMVQFLLDNGAILDAPIHPFGHTALYLAVQQGRHQIASHLIRRGASVHIYDAWTGSGLLHIAAKRGDMLMAGILISAGANVFNEDKRGMTARDMAARSRHPDLEKILLTVMAHHAVRTA